MSTILQPPKYSLGRKVCYIEDDTKLTMWGTVESSYVTDSGYIYLIAGGNGRVFRANEDVLKAFSTLR
jgi:hypothetical protein